MSDPWLAPQTTPLGKVSAKKMSTEVLSLETELLTIAVYTIRKAITLLSVKVTKKLSAHMHLKEMEIFWHMSGVEYAMRPRDILHFTLDYCVSLEYCHNFSIKWRFDWLKLVARRAVLVSLKRRGINLNCSGFPPGLWIELYTKPPS